jgi:hypothetical protein
MKKIFYASLAFSVVLTTAVSCKKKVTTPFTYEVSGLTDVSVPITDSVSIPIQVKTLTGNAETVTLSMDGLPANVTGIITPSTGTPSYNATLKIKALSNAATGTNTITINSYSVSGGIKPYNINLTVSDPPTKALLVNTWTYQSYAQDANQNDTLDNSEIQTLPFADYYKFNGDGTGTVTESGSNTQMSMTWSFSNDYKYITIIVPSYSLNVTMHIDQLTSNKMILKQVDNSGTTWNIFTR